MNGYTITYNGTTQTIQQWDAADPMMTYKSRLPSTFTFRIPGGSPSAAVSIPYLGQITVRDTTLNKVIFVGFRIDYNGTSDGARGEDITLVFADALFRLNRLTYQTQWKITTDGIHYAPFYSPRVWLFMNIGQGTTPWQYWTATAQVQAIISYAQTVCGIPIQSGTIDPPIQMPVYPVESLSCWECITKVVETLPDVTTAFDYTQSPPALNMRIRQNCTPITLAYRGGKNKSTTIKSRDDLQVPQVVITYRSVTNGYITFTGQDVYPPGSQGTVDNAVIQGFDLTGAQRNILQAAVSVKTFDPTDLAFWKDKKPDLALSAVSGLTILDPTINGGSNPNGITITDTTTAHNPVSISTYKNLLLEGQIASWMTNTDGSQVISKEVIVTAHVSYSKTAPGFTSGAPNQDVVNNHPISWRGKLTNAGLTVTSTPVTKTFSQVSSTLGAEVPPPYFAYLFWCSQNNVVINYVSGNPTPPSIVPAITNPFNLQWEGTHEITGGISTYYNCTNTLNLSGGNSAWASMNATIYSVEYDLWRGRTKINFGPHKTLSLGQYWQIAMMARTRIAWDNPSLPSTGQDYNSSQPLGSDLAQDNTVEDSTPNQALKTLIGTPSGGGVWTETRDAGVDDGLPQWTAQHVSTSTGAVDATMDTIDAKMSDLDLDTNVINVKWRVITYNRLSDCMPCYRWALCGEEITGAPDPSLPT